ncbi:MAG: hypothetical protein ACPGWR_03350 [Ardenticatenaceae bacterium]
MASSACYFFLLATPHACVRQNPLESGLFYAGMNKQGCLFYARMNKQGCLFYAQMNKQGCLFYRRVNKQGRMVP